MNTGKTPSAKRGIERSGVLGTGSENGSARLPSTKIP